jgi:hypothetical protein
VAPARSRRIDRGSGNNLDVNFGVTEAIRASGMEPGTVDATVGIAPASAMRRRRWTSQPAIRS